MRKHSQTHEHHLFGRHGHRRFGGGGFFGGGRFGGGFMGGPGMRAAKMLASGDLQLIILLLLAEKSRYGYEVIKALEEHSSGVYTPSPGMVYPALTYLEETGFAEASSEGAKKLYTITGTGKDHLAKNRTEIDEVWNHLALYGRKMAGFRQQFVEDEQAEDQFGSDPKGHARQEWRRLKTEFRDLRDQLKAAIYEKLDASVEEKQRILEVLRRAIAEIRGGK